VSRPSASSVFWGGTGVPLGVITTRCDSAGVSPPSSSSQAHTSPPRLCLQTNPASGISSRLMRTCAIDRILTGTVHMFITGKPFFSVSFSSARVCSTLDWPCTENCRQTIGVLCFLDASHSQRKKHGGFLLVSSTYFLLSCRIRRMTHASGSSGLLGPYEYPWLRFFFSFIFFFHMAV